jgi:hypothetical protein
MSSMNESRSATTSMNLKRVLGGGLAAGAVIILSAITMVPVVGNQMDAVLAARNLPPMSGGAMAFFGVVSLANGILLVWLYAAMRPRLGAGPKTAAVASLLLWFVGYFLANVSMVMYGFMPVMLTVIGTAWGLGEMLLAGQFGAWIYREKVIG